MSLNYTELKMAMVHSLPFLFSAWIAGMVFGTLIIGANMTVNDGLLIGRLVVKAPRDEYPDYL